eukprot:TRINITY_DN6452_c0_g1_i7.p1 TRINITY_DN6452_c0_g1~~TRINITY_DN6452_c0_g1_i7.p1  ORF type:complete len:476 (+),score=50.57 TRINITY_DN6452_c0_g1_i7:57-1484(+)
MGNTTNGDKPTAEPTQKGNCTAGAKCEFAHILEDKGKAAEPTQKEICRFFSTGKCKAGTKCEYAHSLEEKKVPEPAQKKICRYYAAGDCKAGAKCEFPHSLQRNGKIAKPTPKQICRYYAAGDCKAEAKCEFSHYLEQNRKVATPKQICKFYAAGDCKAGAICEFSHILEDKGRVAIPKQICKFYAAGDCKAGAKCEFPHSIEENKKVPEPALKKICRYYAAGDCKAGAKCEFPHSLEDKGKGKVAAICIFYAAGDCKAGAKCEFAHVKAVSPYPKTWKPQKNNLEEVDIPQGSKEYDSVANAFSKTMTKAKIVSVTRIQNKMLWAYFVSEKKRMEANNGVTVRTAKLFHGTGRAQPKLIYDGQDGFDTRFANNGLWGRATYFSTTASYSHSYATSDPAAPTHKQMLLATVLVGNCKDYGKNTDSSLVIPPCVDSSTQDSVRRYDSVSGITAGTQVYMVYSNGRGYPEYLITYTA